METYYKASPISRKERRNFAMRIRRLVSMVDYYNFPIVEVFELFSNIGIFNFEILSKVEMENKCGETFPKERHINIREDIYEKACNGDPFSKTTLAHELYHLFFHDEETISLCRIDGTSTAIKVYEDPEWQANCFAGELLVSKQLVENLTVEEVVKKCEVSKTMARYQLEQYRKENKNVLKKNTL